MESKIIENDSSANNSSAATPLEAPSVDNVSSDDALNRFTHFLKLRSAAREEYNSDTRSHDVESHENASRCYPLASRFKISGGFFPELALNRSRLRRRPRNQDGAPSRRSISASHMKDNEDAVVEELLEGNILTEELGHIAISPQHKIHQIVNTDLFPYYPAPKQLCGKEFWLAAAVIDCADYDTTAALLESGAIQYAIATCRSETTHEVRILLVTLLRLAASCYTHVHHLLIVQNDIFLLLFDCLKVSRTKPALMDSIIRWNQLSDSRAYNSFLGIAFGAHTRPTGVQYKYMSWEEKLTYEKHVQIISATYGSLFQDPQTYAERLPAYLIPYVSTFYLSDFAAEIFIDLAPHGFFNTFTSTIVEIKWDRCFNIYLENAPFNITTIKFHRLLHQSPRTVAAHLAFPFSIYKHCFAYLSWGLRTLLDAEYYRNPDFAASWNRSRTYVPLEFCTACAETLRTFLDFPALGASPPFRKVRAFLRQPRVINQLLRFVLAMPNVVDAKKDPHLDLLYSAVWSLIHSTSYTFPFMFGTLVEFCCDKTVPDCLGVQAAMYVAATVSFARVQLKRSEIVSVYKRLLRNLKQSQIEPSLVRRRRQELVFRMAVILCPSYFGLASNERHGEGSTIVAESYEGSIESNSDDSGAISVSQIFSPYEFKLEEGEDDENCGIENTDTTMRD